MAYQNREQSPYNRRDNLQQVTPQVQVDFYKIIVQGDPEVLVTAAEKIGQLVAEQKLTTSQIRNVYGTVRQIQLRWDTNPGKSYREAVLLRPKLAYYAERAKKDKGGTVGMETLQTYLEPAIKLLSDANLSDEQKKQRFDRFTDYFEAIVAYHRKFGGK